jgi:hypothetical protein
LSKYHSNPVVDSGPATASQPAFKLCRFVRKRLAYDCAADPRAHQSGVAQWPYRSAGHFAAGHRALPGRQFRPALHSRWGIEEGFKLVKQRQHLEGFSGELPEFIAQEIQAKILLHNITQAVCHTAQQQLQADKRTRWQVNRAYAFKQIGRILVFGFKVGQYFLNLMAFASGCVASR